MQRNHRGTQADTWMPESRVAVLANIDLMDDRIMKFRGEEFSTLPYNVRESSDMSLQDNEVNRKFWMDRELQSQGFMSRKISRSVRGGGNNAGLFHFERSSTGPRSGPFIHREEDSCASQELVPVCRHNYQMQKEPHTKDGFYPAMSNVMDYQRGSTFNEGLAARSFGLRKGVDSQQAAFEGTMMGYTPDHRKLQGQKSWHEGRFTGPLEYSMLSFAGGDSHPHSRFHEGPYDQRPPNSQFQEDDRLFSGDSYLLQSSPSNGSYNFPMPMHQGMAFPTVSQREMSLGPNLNKCSCCKEHMLSQGSFKQHSLTQYPPLGYQHSQSHTYFPHYGNHRNLLSKSSKNSLHSLQSRRKVADPLCEAVQARKENSPPLPGPWAPPYVLCQGCEKIVQISDQLYHESTVLKVRCSSCRRVSKFCNIVHPFYQALLKDEKAANALQQADCDDTLNKPKLPSAPTTVTILDSTPTVQEEIAYRKEVKAEGYSHGKVKQIEASESPVETHDLSSLAIKSLQEREVDETNGSSFMPWSRLGTFHEDSSSFLSASGSISTKNTAVHKLQESQQLDYSVHFVAPSARDWRTVHGKDCSHEIDSALEQMDEKGSGFLSDDLQGLMLESLQEGSHGNLKVEEKGSYASQKNQSYQDTNNKAVCLSGGGNQKLASSSTREQTYHILGSSLSKSSNKSVHAISPEMLKIGCHSPESGNNQTETADIVAKSTARAPNTGSPLYEYLSYDSGSEIVEAPKNYAQAKQTSHAALSRDTSKGSNFLANFRRKNMHHAKAEQGHNKNAIVVVNGMTIPHDAVKSAGKRAGTIRPGAYWYDYEAGFWGVMGGPCLGIVPPFIAEFKIPLSKDCAGGTTDIYVNGRELHQKDLAVLAGRGLPRTPGKSYMVDISGQIVDKSSGQMLRSLGRLAPTMQKRGHGCGMFQQHGHL